mmetsp:Transcript_4476/g.6693  ORF Transcript_4476/g.6693 Transcript_4476/m.6693 type:complete len:294 (+) Transcript_4476:284-1165(+)
MTDKDERKDNCLLSFRKFLHPCLQEPVVSMVILEYIEPDLKFAVVRQDNSHEYVRQMIKAQLDIHINPKSLHNTVNAPRMWFLPGWFMMFGAQFSVLRMRSKDNKPHYVWMTAASDSKTWKNVAHVYDSGRVIELSTPADIQSYLRVNSYTDVLPMTIGYTKFVRKNSVIDEMLSISRVYYDIKNIPAPEKKVAARKFHAEKQRLLKLYFENVEKGDQSELRFKPNFCLSSPRVFDESQEYKVTKVKFNIEAAIPTATENPPTNITMLRQNVSSLPLFRYSRRRKPFPSSLYD